MVTLEEVELLASLLARTGISPVEAAWCNGVLNRLRVLAVEAQVKPLITTPPVVTPEAIT